VNIIHVNPKHTVYAKPKPKRTILGHSLLTWGFGVLALMAGIGIGLNMYGPPKTIVVHETGPTHTVYSPAPAPPVKTIEVKLPQSCKEAVALAATVANNAVTMADSSLPLIDAMKDAFVAASAGNKQAQNAAITKMSTINAGTLKSKVTYASTYPQYTAKWQQCQKEIK
jgi:hypothetical protein